MAVERITDTTVPPCPITRGCRPKFVPVMARTSVWPMMPQPVMRIARGAGVLVIVDPATMRLKVNVPASPFGSAVVPEAVYVPDLSAPEVVTAPELETTTLGEPAVWV